MDFQQGDACVRFQGEKCTLRLTLGALAEISDRLSVAGPRDLAQALQYLDIVSARHVFEALIRPCHGAFRPVSNTDIASALPAICEVFEYAFG